MDKDQHVQQPAIDQVTDSEEFMQSSIGYHLRQAHLMTFRRFARSEAEPITPTQFMILLHIDVHPRLSQSDLGNFLGLDRATTMAIVRKLQARDLLQRHHSTADRRKYELDLTPSGRTTLRKFLALQAGVEAELTSRLNAREQAQLLKLLKKLTSETDGLA